MQQIKQGGNQRKGKGQKSRAKVAADIGKNPSLRLGNPNDYSALLALTTQQCWFPKLKNITYALLQVAPCIIVSFIQKILQTLPKFATQKNLTKNSLSALDAPIVGYYIIIKIMDANGEDEISYIHQNQLSLNSLQSKANSVKLYSQNVQ